MLADTPPLMLKTPIFSLKCVDALSDIGFRLLIFDAIFILACAKMRCVDLTAETLSGYRLPDELPTDGLKSD